MSQEQPESQTPIPVYALRTLRHRLLSKLYEIVLTPLDITVQSEIQMMSEPPRADLLLLRRNGSRWTEEQRQLLPDGIRDRHVRYHLLECKFSESVNQWVLQQALGYDYFYRQTQKLKPSELQTYIVSAKTPQSSFLNRFGYHSEDKNGVYVTSLPLLERVVVLVVNELRDEPHNEFLRLFASKQKVRKHTMEEVLDQPLSNWSEELWSVVFGLQQFYQLEEESMKRELTVDDVMEMGNNIRKRVIASASPEDRLAGLAPEERLAGLAPEELASMMEQIEALLSKHPLKKTRHRRKS